MIDEGVRIRWLRRTEFPAEPNPWALLLEAGVKQAATEFGRRTPPCAGQLTHRREVIEALLILRDEKPGYRWICEASYHEPGVEGVKVPDGKLVRGKKCCAVEVERKRKMTDQLREKLKVLCRDYDRVIYFSSAQVQAALAQLKVSEDFSNLELRPLPSEKDGKQQWEKLRTEYTPSPQARRVLKVINEEGNVARAQLHRVLGWTPSKLDRALVPLETHSCIRQGHEVKGDKGWVWCNYRGAYRSDTGLGPPTKSPSRGELVRRFVLMEVRLDLFAKWPEAKWITRRVFEKGRSKRLKDAPHAIVERGGLRYAVVVMESTPASRKKTIARLKRWRKEYAGVLCYRAKRVAGWTEVLVRSHGMGWVDFRDMPTPPPSGPYKRLEEEWRSGREFYRPTDEEQKLLDLAMTEGRLSEIQLHRALGCTPKEADRLVDSLIEHNCLRSENGWLYCNGRGARLSNTDLRLAKVPTEDGHSQHFALMELRLGYGEPVSSENWRTIRQITPCITGTASMARAAVKIDGAWYVVALFFRGFHKRSIASSLARLSKEKGYRGVKCFCLEEQVESFKRFIERYGLSSVEVEAFRASPDELAHTYQEDYFASLRLTKKERKAHYRHKIRANRAVYSAIRNGTLIKPDTCENGCHIESPRKLHGHHEDYSKPLDVRWLCTKCHKRADAARKEAQLAQAS
jgi:hypothetical protein